MSMKHRRRRYIVDTGFQGRLVLCFMTAALMGSVAASLLFNHLAAKRLEELRWSVFITAPSTGEILKPLFISVSLFSFIFVSVLLVIAMVWILKRADGPLYRIVKNLEQIQQGDLSSDIILRQQDEFADAAAALNEMLDNMRKRFREFKAGYDEISQTLVELEIAHAKGLPIEKEQERIIALVQELQKKILQDPKLTGQ